MLQVAWSGKCESLTFSMWLFFKALDASRKKSSYTWTPLCVFTSLLPLVNDKINNKKLCIFHVRKEKEKLFFAFDLSLSPRAHHHHHSNPSFSFLSLPSSIGKYCPLFRNNCLTILNKVWLLGLVVNLASLCHSLRWRFTKSGVFHLRSHWPWLRQIYKNSF